MCALTPNFLILLNYNQKNYRGLSWFALCQNSHYQGTIRNDHNTKTMRSIWMKMHTDTWLSIGIKLTDWYSQFIKSDVAVRVPNFKGCQIHNKKETAVANIQVGCVLDPNIWKWKKIGKILAPVTVRSEKLLLPFCLFLAIFGMF